MLRKKFQKIRKLTSSIFRALRKFQKIIGIASIMFFILAISLYTYKAIYVDESYVRFPKSLQKEVIAKLEYGKKVNEILLKYKNNLKFVTVYKIKDSKEILEKIYPNNVSLKTLKEYYSRQTFLSKTILSKSDNTDKYYVTIGFDYNIFKSMVGIIISSCLAVYWILFAV